MTPVEPQLPTLLLVLMIPLVLALALTRKPQRLLLLGVLAMTLPDADWIVGGARVDSLDLVLGGIVLSAIVAPGRMRHIREVPYLSLWLLLGVLLSISYLAAPLNAENLTDPVRITYQLYRYCWKPILFYPLGCALIGTDAKNRAAAVNAVVVAGVIIAVHASIQGYALDDPRGFFTGGNTLGGALLAPFVFALAGALVGANTRRFVLHMLAAVVIARGFVFANSRGAAVAIAAAVAAFLGMLLRWPDGRQAALRAVVLGAAATVAVFVLKPDVLERPNIKHILTAVQGTADENLRWRIQQRWPIFVEKIQEHPWVGVGTNRDLDLSESANTPHNGYLSLAVTYGVPAAAIITLLMVCGILNGLRLSRKVRSPEQRAFGSASAAVLSGVLVHNIVESTLMVTFILNVSWLLVAMAAMAALREHAPVAASGALAAKSAARARPVRRRAWRPALNRALTR